MKLTSSLIAILLILSSCLKDRIEANGNIISESRSLDAFTRINLSGSKRVYVSYGSEFKVELKGSSNLISRYKTTVSGKTLNLKYNNLTRVVDDDIIVYVKCPQLEELNLSGSGMLFISGYSSSQRLFVRISGSGLVKVEDPFKVDDVKIDISGSGNADLDKVEANKANINMSGSGETSIGVSEVMKAKISGSGKIYYWGNPIVESKISGSGKLIKRY